MLFANGAKSVMSHEAQSGCCQGREIAIHDRQMQSVQIGNVPSHKEGCNLPFAIAGKFGGTEQAIQNHERIDRAVTLTHQVVIGKKILLLNLDVFQNINIALSEIRDALELADKYIRG
ncbi:hypothetical protein A4R28_32530 (plasmid) [Mesorhizobium ciceri]|nr:hypothetical protein A4R28_32530 [Mesorhizobium ciceri]